MTTRSTPRFQTLGYAEVTPPAALKDDRVDLRATGAVFFAYRRLIMLAVLVSAVIGYGLALVVGKTYEARATVFVTTPTFSTELTPQPFSIEAYERLAQSDYIRNRVTQAMREKKLVSENESPGVLRTLLYPSREPLKPFLPLVELIARARTPALAQSVANAWADIFMAEQTKLAVIGKASSVDFILAEYPKASARVLADQREVNDERTRLDRAFTVARSSAALDLKKSRLTALENVIVHSETELLAAQVDLKQGRERLTRLAAELTATTPVLTLTKGPSDEALWNGAIRGLETRTTPADPSLGRLSIRTEETNPVYVRLSQDLADVRVAVGALEARVQSLTQQVQQVRKDAAGLRDDLLGSETRLDVLKREHTMQLAPRQLALNEAEARFGKLQEKIGDAQIAKAESDSNVKIGAYAELPVASVSPSTTMYMATAMLLGFVGAVGALWILSYAGVLKSSTRESPPPATPAVTS